jgi:hypothetical protein
MLDSQIIVNLLLELGVGVDLVKHDNSPGERFKCAARPFPERLGGIVDRVCAVSARQQPSEGIPKGGTCVLAVCTTLGQLNYFVTLALQQHGQQSALRKGRDQFSHDEIFLFFLSEDFVIYRVGERALGVFSERLTVSRYANLRLGREPTNL